SDISLFRGPVDDSRQGGSLDVSALSGVFNLSASMTDIAGNQAYADKSLLIDRDSPRVQLDDPSDDGFLSTEFSVSGVVEDAHLESWALVLRDKNGTMIGPLEEGVASSHGVFGRYA